MRATLRGVPLLAREGHICVRGALPRRYNHRVDPWSCRSADSLLDPSKTPPSVLPFLLMSNIGGARWPRIRLSMGETAWTQSRRMLELWGSKTGVTSSYSYHCDRSCAACRRYPLCRPRASVVRWIGGLCYDI